MLKNEKGFTLIEMLIVLLVISVLIILIVPNLGDRSADVHRKGCEALVELVQAQVEAYHIEENDYPVSLDDLVTAEYIKDEQTSCQNENLVYDGSTGNVSEPS